MRNVVECRACNNLARWQTITEKDHKGKKKKIRWGKKKKIRWHDQFCIEHRHEIANFDMMMAKLDARSDPGLFAEGVQ